MTGHRDWLIDFNNDVKNKVRFVDNSSIAAEGIGRVMIKRKDGKPAFVNDVLYVPSMKNNLLNLGQLVEKGFSVNMRGNFIEVFDSKLRSVIKVPLSKNRTFKVNLSATKVQCLSSSVNDERWMWHYRYGHLNIKSLNQLAAKKMVIGLPDLKSPS